jgi:hypothetical protein
MFALRSAVVETEKLQKIGGFPMSHNSPKAEVRGSNPFGRAMIFKDLTEKAPRATGM